MQVSRMFTRIVPSYDLMNSLMSGGRDRSWRELAAALADPPAGGRALDVATGTGDVALALALAGRACQVVGVDACAAMVASGAMKASGSRYGGQLRFALSDALALPFRDAAFDCVTIAFGIRNIADPVGAFREMRRVVKPGGRVVCLEIMPPEGGFLGRCYRFYLTRFIPLLGGWVSGHPEAYHYLSTSVLNFLSPPALQEQMEAAGFSSVAYRELTFNTIALHVGVR